MTAAAGPLAMTRAVTVELPVGRIAMAPADTEDVLHVVVLREDLHVRAAPRCGLAGRGPRRGGRGRREAEGTRIVLDVAPRGVARIDGLEANMLRQPHAHSVTAGELEIERLEGLDLLSWPFCVFTVVRSSSVLVTVGG